MMIDVPIAPDHPVALPRFSKSRMDSKRRSIGKTKGNKELSI
jgi:hypothetical protein